MATKQLKGINFPGLEDTYIIDTYSRDEIETALDTKLDKKQDPANAGKVLLIGADGEIIPGEVAGDGSGGTIVPQVQADWNETNTNSKAYILNKPDVVTPSSMYSYVNEKIEKNKQVQVDYYETSAHSIKHIKNRPFGFTEMISQINFDYTEEMGSDGVTPIRTYALDNEHYLPINEDNVGETYKVIYDGIAYTTIAKANKLSTYLGNGAIYDSYVNNCGFAEGAYEDLLTGEADTGEPFCIAGSLLTGSLNQSVTGHTIRVYQEPQIPEVLVDYIDEKVANVDGGGNSGSVDGIQKIAVEVEHVPNTQLSNFEFDTSFGTALYRENSPCSFYPIIGRTYQVTWDGVTYECVAQDGSALQTGVIILGNNLSFSGEEPFIIGFVNGWATIVSTEDSEPTTHYVRIYSEGEAVVDYNQNNINGEGYVHNRPFYQNDDMVQVLSVNNVSFPYSQLDGWEQMGAADNNLIGVWTQPWKHAKVTWDGVEYICEPVTMDGLKYIGGSSNAPFYITVVESSNNGIVWYCEDIENKNTTPTASTPLYSGTLSLVDSGTSKYNAISSALFSLMDVYNQKQYLVQIDDDINYYTVWSGTTGGVTIWGIGNPSIAGLSSVTGGNTNTNFAMYVKSDNSTVTWAYFDSSFENNAPTIKVANIIPVTHTFSIELGDYSVKTIDPKFLPGALLPSVTTNDNGKIIEVVNGKYELVDVANSSIARYISELLGVDTTQ